MDAFERLITVNRYNPPLPLELEVPLVHALDKQWCSQMSRSMMKNFKWTICEATETLHELLPSKRGLYMFVWRIAFPFPCTKLGEHFFRIVLYVGQAGADSPDNTLQKRYRQEYASIVGRHPETLWQSNSSSREDKLRRMFSLRDLEYWYHDNLIDSSFLKTYEQVLISLFSPPANTQGVNVGGTLNGTLGKAIPAF